MSCSCSANDEPRRHPGFSRRAVLGGSLALGAIPFAPRMAGAKDATFATLEGSDEGATTNDFGFDPSRPPTEKHVRPIMFPVLPDASLGRATWSDTYWAPRSGGRKHEGQDLMGKKMLKLLACVSGTIVELRHQSGGNSLYLKGDDGWYYCYLHINNDRPGTDDGSNLFQYAFAPGLAIGKRVLKGDLIGFLGDSGNAEGTAPHLHFEIRMPNARWYNAAAVNPSFSLTAAEPAKVRAKVPATAFAPLPNAQSFATQQATDFLGTVPSIAWLAGAVSDLEGGVVGLDPWIERLLAEPGAAAVSAPAIRLYLGYFLRIPDFSGLDYWIRQVRAGRSLDLASSQFAGSSEFIRRYGELDNRGFLVQIYNNLFERDPDPSGLDYWLRRLDGGMKRGVLMRQFCESSEYRRKTANQVRVLQVFTAMGRRAPRQDEYFWWWAADRNEPDGLQALIRSFRTGTEYAARF